jgi:hypothetical protein
MDELAARLRAQNGPDAAFALAAAALGTATAVAATRTEESWAAFPQFLLLAIPCAFLFFLALLPERGATEPELASIRERRWRPAVLVVAVLLLAGSLFLLARVLGVDEPGPGTTTWVAALTGLLALALAARHDSPGLQLVGLVWLAVAFVALVDWIDSDAGTTALRNVLLAVGILFLLIARALRPTRLGHSHVAVAVGALLIILGAIAGALGDIEAGGLLFGLEGGAVELGDKDGWELVLVVATLGAFAYSGWQRYRGTAYPGLIGLLAFLVLTGEGSLAGWPLVLLLAAAAALAWGVLGSGGRDRSQAPPG